MSRFVLLLFMIFLCDTMYCAEANTAYVDSLIASGKTYLDQEYNSHAINLLLRAERIAKKNNNLSQLAEIYTLFASIYERNGEFKQSLEYQKKLNEVISAIAELKIQEVINNNDMITLDQHNQEIHDLKLKKRDNLLFLYLLIAGVICVGTIIMCLSSRWNKKRLQNLLNEQTRDIEQKNKALQEQIKKKHASEQKFKALFDSSTDSIFIHDPEDMRIIDVNKRTCDTYGYSREEMLSMNINDLSSTSMLTVDSPEAREFIHRLYNGEIIKKEWEAKAKDGTLFWQDIHAIIIKLDDKDRLLIFARNIDDKKKFQKELEESRALLHSIIHNLPVACYAIDKEGKLILQSAQSIQRWGDLIGKKVNVIYADMKNIDNELIERSKNLRDRVYDGEEINDEYTIKINDDIKYIQMKLIPLEKDNEIIGILGVDIDITEIRKNEQKLLYLKENLEKMVETEIKKRKDQQEIIVQKSKLESLGQLAAGIAHEINQPIGLISLGIDNINERIKENKQITNQYLQQKFEKFFTYIERIHQIIDHIGTFSRDQKDITFDEININTVIKDILMMIRQQYEDHDISFTLSLDENIRPILGNQFKLEQVILNLITNARDAIDEKFTDLHSEEKQISITTIQDKQFAYIKILDNGIGIQKKNIDHIFEPFYTTKDPEKGTGLGLSVSYGILEDMNAEISVRSKPNLFTTFTIKFETTSF